MNRKTLCVFFRGGEQYAVVWVRTQYCNKRTKAGTMAHGSGVYFLSRAVKTALKR